MLSWIVNYSFGMCRLASFVANDWNVRVHWHWYTNARCGQVENHIIVVIWIEEDAELCIGVFGWCMQTLWV